MHHMFVRNTHPRLSEGYVLSNVSDCWQTLDTIVSNCKIVQTERRVVSVALNSLWKQGLILKKYKRVGSGTPQEYKRV